MSYRVYKAFFNRPDDTATKFDRHVALFIRTGSHPESYQGEMFHVIEGSGEQKEQTVLVFNTRANCTLNNFRSFYKATEIGTIPKQNLDVVRSICKNTPNVIAPLHIEKPNCVTWVDNVIYDLAKNSVMTFESSFSIPSQKKPLQVTPTSSSTQTQGSSASSASKKTASSSSTTHRGSSSSTKHRHPNST